MPVSQDSNNCLKFQSNCLLGEKKNVEGTVFDLRKPQFLTKERLDSVPGGGPGGYDHNFCLSTDGKRRIAARFRILLRVFLFADATSSWFLDSFAESNMLEAGA